MAFAMLLAAPAFSQTRVDSQARIDVGPLHIRIVDSAPPRAYRERRPRSPGPGYVWIKGYNDRQGDQWVWVHGRWERPHNRDRWIGARYVRERNAWRYEPAHWSSQQIVEGDDYRRWKEENRTNRDQYDRHDRHDNY
jgi:hypothetical protein